MAGKTNINDIVVNTAAIAKMFNLTERRVRQLVEEGVINRVAHGRFNLVDTVSKYVTFLKLSAEGMDENDVTESLEYEKWLHEKAKREKAEIELALLKNEVHRAEDVEKVLNHMLTAFRSKLLGLPTKLANRLINISDPKAIEVLIERDVHEALEELSEYDPSMFFEVTDDEEVEEDSDGSQKHTESI